MPYIIGDAKEQIDRGRLPHTVGELNYVFTRTALLYLNEMGESYQTCNDIMGALEGCKLEFYRRLVAGYEDKKKELNGDVY